MLCSAFQHPFYPYVGAETRKLHIVNVPLAADADGTIFWNAVTEKWLPALEAFNPERGFISAGFDAHRKDEMSSMGLAEADYMGVTEQIKRITEHHTQARIVSVLEGGYALHALECSAAAHIKELSGL